MCIQKDRAPLQKIFHSYALHFISMARILPLAGTRPLPQKKERENSISFWQFSGHLIVGSTMEIQVTIMALKKAYVWLHCLALNHDLSRMAFSRPSWHLIISQPGYANIKCFFPPFLSPCLRFFLWKAGMYKYYKFIPLFF